VSAVTRDVGTRLYELARRLYPICRSITGNGVRATLAMLREHIDLQIHEVPSGTAVFDWVVPDEWNIRDAYIKDPQGRRVVDFQRHNLHVMSYSMPVRARMRLEELRPYLHHDPQRPDAIPYRTSYYRRQWGFCLTQRQADALADVEYEVLIDSDLAPGSLTYGELFIPGRTDREILIFTHVCHPSLANDNVSGMAVATLFGAALAATPGRHSVRMVFAPGTIGCITWLAQNEPRLAKIDHALVIGLLGDRGPLTYKRSQRGDAMIDRVSEYVVRSAGPQHRVIDFHPYGYDERQLCSPGFNLPAGRLTRSPNEGYPEYHSSADDLSLIDAQALAESYAALERIVHILDADGVYRNLSPKCEPQLGKRGLYRSTGGGGRTAADDALLWVLNQSDGARSLLQIAQRAGIAFEVIEQAALDLERVALLARVR
jgi:aminopeptidase-like protein